MVEHKRMIAEYDAIIAPYLNQMNKMKGANTDFQRQGQQSFNEVDKAAQKATGSLGLAAKAATALGGAGILYGFKNLAETAKMMDNQMRAIGASTDEAQKKIYNLAIMTRTPLESTVGLLRSMQKSLTDQSLDTTIRQVGTLNRLLTIGGLDGNARGSVALQFGQALQSGVLQGDELRSLREAAPVELLEAIAKAAGGTVVGLKDLGSAGALTRDVMVQALSDLEQTSKDKFSDFKMTIGEASDALRTALVATAGAFDEGVNATGRLAATQQAVADYMLNNAEAAGTLGEALNVVLDVALVLAGSRGIALVGGAMVSVGARVLTATTTIAGAGTALRGIMTLMGGPWGVAIFAVGTAFMALSKHVKSTEDRLKDTSAAMDRAKAATEKYAALNVEIESDLRELEKANRAVEAAIIAGGDAAEASARREVAAIQTRINANTSLRDAQLLLAEGEVDKAKEKAAAAGASLINDGRNLLGDEVTAQNIGPQQMNDELQAIADMTDEMVMQQVQTLLEAQRDLGDGLTDLQLEYLRSVVKMNEENERIAKEEEENRRARLISMPAATRGASEVRDRYRAQAIIEQAELKKIADAKAKIESDYQARIKEMGEQAEELAGLRAQRVMAEAARAAAIANQNLAGIATADAMLSEIDAEVEKITKAEEKVGDMSDKIKELQEAFAELGIDNDDEITDALQSMADQLAGAEAAGKDLDDVTLSALEGQFDGVINAATRFLTAIGLIKGDLADLEMPNADDYAAQYTQERFGGTADPANRELIAAVAKTAHDLGVAAKDVLAVISFETAGSLDPWKKGQTTTQGEHRGLIQWGEPQREQYGVTQDMSIAEQMEAVTQYMKDRGVKPGDGLAPIYASVLAGHASKVNASDTAQGGVVSNVTSAVNGPLFEGHKAKAEGMLEAYAGPLDAATEQLEEMDKLQEDAEKERIRLAKAAKERAEEGRVDMAKDIEAMQERADFEETLIGQSAERQAYLTTQFELMNAAKERGIDIDEQIAGSTRTYREEIERLSQAAADDIKAQEARGDALADVDRKTQAVDQANADMRQGILDAILEGDNFVDVLANVAKALARAALEAALFGSASGGGGVLGSIFGSMGGTTTGAGGVTSGGGLLGQLGGTSVKFANGGIMTGKGEAQLRAYANGGVANSPQVAVYGEGDMAEAFVPLPDGRSIPVTLNMPDMARLAATPQIGGAGAQSGGLSIIEVRLSGDIQAQMLKISEDTSVRVVSAYDESAPERVTGIINDQRAR